MLVSEENSMKSHTNQCLVGLLSPLISLVELRTRGHTMVSGVQTPSQGPDRGRPHSDVSLQLLESTALAWGIIRRSAYILAEITVRKSQ